MTLSTQILEADDKRRAKDRRFRAHEFRRLVGLLGPHRRTLVAGMAITVIYALLHTASIGGVVPILKMLLEEEGFVGWVDRTLAAKRLGVKLAPPDAPDAARVRVVRVTPENILRIEDDRTLVSLADPENRPANVWLGELAHADAGQTITLIAHTDAEGKPSEQTVQLTDLTLGSRILRAAAGWLPSEVGSDKLRALTYVLVGLVGMVILANLCRYFGQVLIAKAVLSAMMGLRTTLYERTLRLPMAYFSDSSTADTVTRFVQDILEVQRGLMTLFGKFFREPIRAVLLLALAFSLDWRITITVFLVTPIVVVLFWAIGRKVKNENRKLLRAYGRMIDALTASLQNLRVVKAYTAEDQEQARLGVVDRHVLKQQLSLAKLQALTSPVMETLAVAAGSVTIVWLAGRVLDRELSISNFGALAFTLSMVFDPLRKLSDVYVRLQRSTAGAERVFDVIDRPGEVHQGPNPVELGPLERCIEYVGVSFTYPNANVPALTNIDLTIHQGETVALVGPNGCGKTTLANLLLRFYDPDANSDADPDPDRGGHATSGVIRYDAIDIRHATLTSLRWRIGIVSQEAVVFGGTPLENITYGDAHPDRQRAEHAARRASADEFIQALPGAYDAALGERGSTLSGGQRQRLAIARAIYRDAPVLIFDEATSQIDSESEIRIQSALREFSKGRTTIIIAHRLSTIQFAQRIVVMDRGKILDSGTHAELVDRCPLYRTLCQTQLVGA